MPGVTGVDSTRLSRDDEFRLQHHVERRLGGAAEAREAALRGDLTQPRFTGLGAEREPTSCASDAGVHTTVDAA